MKYINQKSSVQYAIITHLFTWKIILALIFQLFKK